MSNLANNNTVRRRKTATTKPKSKHTTTNTNSATTNATNTPTTIPIATTINSITNVGSHNPSSSIMAPTLPNERLQRYSLSDILVGLMRRTIIKQSNNDDTTTTNYNAPSPTFVLQTPNPALCNGSITCCRDVNCSLNLLNGQLSTIMQHQQQQEEPQQHKQQEQQRQNVQCLSISSNKSSLLRSSHSLNGRRSRSSTATSFIQDKTDITTLTSEQPLLRNDSPISDGNSNSKMEKFQPNFNQLTTPDLSLTSVDRIFTVNLQLDMCTWLLFALAFCTRFFKLTMPRHVVFDEIHYGKYISLYMKNMFFFDQHPPLGKQLIAAVTHMATNFNGNYTFPYIGAEYSENVPIFWLRFVPALCGSALAPIVYKLLLAARLSAWFALLGGLLIIFENALLTQSRFILMESMLLFFATCGLYYFIRFQNCRFGSIAWLLFGLSAASCFTFAASVKYAGFLTYGLTAYLSWRHFWDQLYDATLSNLYITLETICRTLLFTVVPIALYVGIFYIHLQTLYRAGPHDSAMTSAFQASLKGGLASITRGQPIKVVHGSQITLRHSHGRTCWLHSHPHVYPVRYPDQRGSSHQQQVTCYSFKDVNNWWIVKRPDREDLVVGDDLDVIRHGDIIQLVHGMTSRGLNSHDVAGPMTPDCQEVSCYIDYEIGMLGELLWKVEILNRDRDDAIWHAIKSEVRLIHHTTGAALRTSGRQLPEWGFNQHEVVADRVIDSRDAIWNVEEHRYTNTQNQRERERQLLKAEMIPTKRTKLNFMEKFFELQSKMFWYTKRLDDHMYSSSPFEWPLLDKGIAYWVNPNTNSQIHLLGNILIWYSGTIGLLFYIILNIFYILRRRRLHFDLPESEWKRFRNIGDLFLIAYLIHYLPYFLVERTLFLHHYLPAYLYKILLLCYVFEHIDYVLRLYHYRNSDTRRIWLIRLYRLSVIIWFISVVWIFIKFLPITYGLKKMTSKEIINLRWKDTWDFILPRDDYLKYLFI